MKTHSFRCIVEISTLNTQVNQLNDYGNAAKVLINNLHGQLKKLANDDYVETIQYLTEKCQLINQYDKRINCLKDDIDKKAEEILHQSKQIQELKMETERDKKLLTETNQLVDTVKKDLNQKLTAEQLKSKRFDDQLVKVSVAQKQQDEAMTNKLNEMKNELKEKQGQIDQLNDVHKMKVDEFKENIAKLKKEKQRLVKTMKESKKKDKVIKELKEKRKEKENEVDALKEENERTKKEQQKWFGLSNKQGIEIEALKNKLNEPKNVSPIIWFKRSNKQMAPKIKTKRSDHEMIKLMNKVKVMRIMMKRRQRNVKHYHDYHK
jgi:chromosome segregation ATPase